MPGNNNTTPTVLPVYTYVKDYSTLAHIINPQREAEAAEKVEEAAGRKASAVNTLDLNFSGGLVVVTQSHTGA